MIASIALSCGYASADYFSKVITETTGKKTSAHRIRKYEAAKARRD